MPVQSTCAHCGGALLVQKQSRINPAGNYHRACYHAARVERSQRTLLSRAWAKVNRNGPVPPGRPDLGPCWVWTAARRFGYGGL